MKMTKNIYSTDKIAETMEALAYLGFGTASYELLTDSEGSYYKITAESTIWDTDKKAKIGFKEGGRRK